MNQIPKIIHYCWFGGNKIPKEALRCINSWKEIMPDYELKIWNEENFDITCNEFVYQAYNNKKYAFVTDFVRLYALYNYGGIYMDTDVEVIKPLNRFLKHRAFTSFENEYSIPTGMMAACKNNEWIKILLDFYNDKEFKLDDGSIYNIPNTRTITDITLKNYNLKLNNKYQVLDNNIHIYPFDYFCAKDWRTGKINITENTYTIHHFMGSWVPKKEKVIGRVTYGVKRLIRGCIKSI
ncbi:glycosyltransferase family 32 protein [Clostridium mediterraneense]|uniref:glycosyltransferase family 32 protein n=1 Tax=Clostridium mediterraneense TaxID=1805472 RepID=UPI00082E58EE|nr:glycosyltransferase [Clostridium mediterraneense]